ncbi:MAG: AMP-binding protein [Nitrospirota bacterium]|nr:AMP-binding protein [Nitrospirota bacterium]
MTGKTIQETFFRVAAEYPHNIAFHLFREGWKTITYEAFAAEVSALAVSLVHAGVQKGDRVAIIAENRPEWCAAYLSVLTAGGIAVPMDPQLGPGEIRNLLHDSETEIVFHSQMTGAAVKAAAEKLSEVGHTIQLIHLDAREFRPPGGSANPGAFPEASPEDIASIIYTSGTTGRPKGVILTHHNFCSDAEALKDARIVTHEDNVLSVLPLHHTYAFMCTFLVPVFLGASITYPASLKGPDLLSAINERGVTILIGVPQLLNLLRNGIMKKISDLPGPLSFLLLRLHRLSGYLREQFGINTGRFVFASAHRAFGERFRFFGSGGAKLDPSIMKDLEALGFTLLEGYGLTETSPVLTFNPPGRRKPGSAGKPLPSVTMRILNPSDTGEGEIEVKGPMVMKGYYKNPEATADAIRDGWFRTGDLGRIDRDGYLFITGRSKEVIVLSSGKNIYPEEVEKVYLTAPLIKEICVTGIESGGITESLHAVIVPDFDYAKQAGISNIQEAVKWEINELSGKLPSYLRVTGYSVTKEPLPRTPLGKLRRFMIKGDIIRPAPAGEKVTAEEAPAVRDETAQAIINAIGQFSKDRQKIMPDDNLELDLGLDSLSKIELVASLEKTFSLQLPENFLADIHTVGELTVKIRIQTSRGVSAEGAVKTSWKNILTTEPAEEILFGESKALLLPMFLLHTILKLIFKLFFRLEARGVQNIPAGGNFILAPNHASYLDGFAVLLSVPFARFRNICTLGLSDYFSGTFKGWLARLGNVIPIDSSSYLNKALQTSAQVLRHGYSLSVFPEGGRSFDGNLMEFKKGVGILAVETGVAVVPVLIEGAFEALPRTAVWPRPRKIIVTFGRPLLASEVGLSKKPDGVDEYQYFANLLRERVRDLKKS